MSSSNPICRRPQIEQSDIARRRIFYLKDRRIRIVHVHWLVGGYKDFYRVEYLVSINGRKIWDFEKIRHTSRKAAFESALKLSKTIQV